MYRSDMKTNNKSMDTMSDTVDLWTRYEYLF